MEQLGRTRVQLDDLLQVRQQLHQLGVPYQAGLASLLQGLHNSRLRGRGLEFDQVRPYQHGDDVRFIDWRVTARTGEVHSKTFQAEREHPVFIMVEQSSAMYFASQGNFKSVQAAYLASIFAWQAMANHDRVGGLVFGGQSPAIVKPQRHHKGVLRLLNQIAINNQKLSNPTASQNENPLKSALNTIRSMLRPESLLILICSHWHLNEQISASILALTRRYNLVLVPISDPLEYQLPSSPLLLFNQSRDFVQINSQQPVVNKHWQYRGWQRHHNWLKLAQQANLLLLPITTATSIKPQLELLLKHDGSSQHDFS